MLGVQFSISMSEGRDLDRGLRGHEAEAAESAEGLGTQMEA